MHTGSRTQIAGATDSVAEGVPPTVIVTTRPRSHAMWWACFQDKGINEIPVTGGLRGAGACLSSRNCYPKVCECKSLLSTRLKKYLTIVTSNCNRSLRKSAGLSGCAEQVLVYLAVIVIPRCVNASLC